jgi:N-acetylglucosamine kinase-like BadF-type ATPase
MKELYFLGLDGGGTKTHLVIINNEGTIVAESTSEASSIDTVSIEQSMAAIRHAYELTGVEFKIDSVFAGIGGISGKEDVNQYNQALRQLSFVKTDAIVSSENDVYAALASGKGELQGMTLILGTGSVCFGINDGKAFRSGGYHPNEGDAGSAFDLGFNALKYYARTLDGRLPKTEFSEAIAQRIQITEFTPLVQYFSTLNRTKVASLAPLVTSFGIINQYAYKILVEAAEEVKLLVEAVYKNLNFEDTDLTIIGGLANADTIYKELYYQNIRQISSKIRIIKSMYTPAHATAIIAKKHYDDMRLKEKDVSL